MQDSLLVLVFCAVIAPKLAKHFKEVKQMKQRFKYESK